jgi:hypothetical protein
MRAGNGSAGLHRPVGVRHASLTLRSTERSCLAPARPRPNGRACACRSTGSPWPSTTLRRPTGRGEPIAFYGRTSGGDNGTVLDLSYNVLMDGLGPTRLLSNRYDDGMDIVTGMIFTDAPHVGRNASVDLHKNWTCRRKIPGPRLHGPLGFGETAAADPSKSGPIAGRGPAGRPRPAAAW